MSPKKSAFSLGLAFLFWGPLPTWGLDLFIADHPNPASSSPRIENLAILKTYHLKDLETAEDLEVSCFLGAEAVWVTVVGGDPPVFMNVLEDLPETVAVEFSLTGEDGVPVHSVTDTYDVVWTPDAVVAFPTPQTSTAPIPTTILPLSGLELTNQEYTVTARVDPNDEISESDENNNSRESDDSFFYAIYSGILNFGPVETQFTQLELGSGACLVIPPDKQAPVSDTSVAEWTHEWGTTQFNPDGACYGATLNPDGFSFDLSARSGNNTLAASSLTGPTPSGLEASIFQVRLDDQGAHYTNGRVHLPDDVSVHGQVDPSALTRGHAVLGLDQVTFIGPGNSGDFTNIFDIMEVWSDTNNLFFHASGLPFTILCNQTEFVLGNGEPLQLANINASHVHFPRYFHMNILDPRSAFQQSKSFPSNDVYFMNPRFESSPATLTPNGINAPSLTFNANNAVVPDSSLELLQRPRTSFPQGDLFWNQFDVEVVDNQIQAEDIPVARFRMRSKRTCPDGDCGDYAPPNDYNVILGNLNASMAGDGALGSPFDALGNNTEWGKFEGDEGTFERDDSSSVGVFYLPGYIATDTADESNRTVSQYLLGSRRFDGPGGGLGDVAPLKGTGSNAHRGIGFYAGLTMGVENLINGNAGEGAALTQDQNIRFNGNAGYDVFDITDRTKYFLRPSGVTGVFNTTFSGILNIYGYDIDFRRFAFRQVYNKLDGKTWLDGSIDLPYPSEFTVSFLNLQLTCEGDLGSGEVDSESEADWRQPDGVDNDGDGLTDEGNGVLTYWDTPISIAGMGFVPTGDDPDLCANNENKELELMTLDDLNGVNTTFNKRAIYSNDGSLKDQDITAAVDTLYDEPMESDEPGFGNRLKRAYLNQPDSFPPQHNGFMNLVGLTDVPVYDDIGVLGHFLNPNVEGLSLPDESFDLFIARDESETDLDFDGVPDAYGSNVQTYRDLLENEEDGPESGDPRPRAKYSWPASGIFQLNYALNYSRSDGVESPQFLGVQKSYQLFNESFPIIGINSNADYINPERTKISFGFSADLSRVLNVVANLTDLGAIDSFLHDVLGLDLGFSLSNILGNVLNTHDLMKTITGGDITQVVKPLIHQALDTPAVENTFDGFTEAIGIVDRVPQEIGILTAEAMSGFSDQILSQVQTNQIGAQLQVLYDDYSAFVAAPASVLEGYTGNPHTPAEMEAIYDEIGGLLEDLAQMEALLNTIHNEIGAARSQVSSFISDLNDGLSDAQSLLNDIQTTILSGGGLLGVFTQLNDNPVIEKVDELRTVVQEVLNAVDAVDIGTIGEFIQSAVTAAGGSIDTSSLSDAQDTIEGLIVSLEEIVEVAESLLQDSYSAMPNVFDDANDILDVIVDNLEDVQSGIDDIDDFIDDILTDADEEIGVLASAFKGLRELVDDTTSIPNQTAYPDYNALQDWGQEILNENAKALIESMIDQVPNGDFKNHLITENGSPLPTLFQSFFVDGMNDLVTTSLDAADLELSNAVGMVIETALQTIPAPSPADLFELIAGAVLNSPPVQDLNESFYDLLSPVADAVDDIGNELMSTVNHLIKEAIGQVAEGLGNLLESVSSAIGAADFNMLQARLDGYAIFNTQELEQLHIEGELGVGGGQFSYQYFAALDVTAWNSENGKGQCDPDGGKGKMDVQITARDVPINISGGQVKIDEVVIGFTLQDAIPVNLFGRVWLRSGLDFEAVALNEIGLEVGIGLFENYIGAKSSGRFESYTLNIVAFYLGISCDFGVLERLDPEVAEFVGEKVPLIGIYVRGAASIPIWNVGCFFQVGAGAEIGVWYFHPDFGGLVGGSLYGKIACLVSLRGGVRAFFAIVAGEGRFSGQGWAAAGVGFCEPADWLNVADARNDKLCLTADVEFIATYANGWEVEGPDVNCCD